MKMARTGARTMRPAWSGILLVALLLSAVCAPPAGPAPGTPPVGAAETPRVSSSPATQPKTSPPAPPAASPTASRPLLAPSAITLQEFAVTRGSGPHDVTPAADGGVWYTGQRNGTLGHLDPSTGRVREVRLGAGSAPHGVIVDGDGVAWVTDSGQNAIVSVDPRAGDKVTVFRLPQGTPNVNLNTAAIDKDGTLWWTGQAGWFGRFQTRGGGDAPAMAAFQAPRGPGPYGITATPGGDVYYASLAGSHIARVEKMTGGASVIEPPTRGQGARRAWSDSKGNVWVSEYNAGQVARFDPVANAWKEWKLPGSALPYSVYVDESDIVWLTDFRSSAIVRFDPASERFDVYPHAPGGNVRQQDGRPGEVWGALSAHDKLLLVRTR